MSVHFDLIVSPGSVSEVALRLQQAPIIAFDTEFIRENTYLPKLALIQVATREDSWLIDVVALKPQDMEPLLRVFQDPGIL